MVWNFIEYIYTEKRRTFIRLPKTWKIPNGCDLFGLLWSKFVILLIKVTVFVEFIFLSPCVYNAHDFHKETGTYKIPFWNVWKTKRIRHSKSTWKSRFFLIETNVFSFFFDKLSRFQLFAIAILKNSQGQKIPHIIIF